MKRDKLSQGQELRHGDELRSRNKWFRLVFQTDGNLVLYEKEIIPVWASKTAKSATIAVVARMQPDGNFVLYDAAGRPVWASDTDGHPGSWLRLQDDRNLVVYGADTRPRWSTGSNLAPHDLVAARERIRATGLRKFLRDLSLALVVAIVSGFIPK